MGRKEKMNKFQVRMSDKAISELEQLQDDLEASTKTEVVRSSLKLVKFLAKEKKSGARLILKDKDGNEREIIF